MTVYAYLRNDYPIPTSQQIEKVLTVKCDIFFVESSTFLEKSQLNALLAELKEGDTVIVPDIRVFTLNLKEFNALCISLMEKKVRLVSMADQLDSDEPMPFYALVDLLAMVTTLQSSHRKIEKDLGRPKINEKVIKEIQFLYHKQGLTMREIADKTEVALGTVYKYTTLYKETESK